MRKSLMMEITYFRQQQMCTYCIFKKRNLIFFLSSCVRGGEAVKSTTKFQPHKTLFVEFIVAKCSICVLLHTPLLLVSFEF